MKSSALPFWLSLLVLVGAAYGGWKLWQNEQAKHDRETPFGSGDVLVMVPLEAFTLTESSGKPFHSESLKGEVWAAYVFFVECPSVCLRMSKTVSSLTGLDELEGVKFVSITCDPENDTPERLDEYARTLGADRSRWFFCTGEFDYIQRVGADILKLPTDIKRLTHSEYIVVVDRTGAVRGMYNLLDPVSLDNARKKMVECLEEDAPQRKLSTEQDDSLQEEKEIDPEESTVKQAG